MKSHKAWGWLIVALVFLSIGAWRIQYLTGQTHSLATRLARQEHQGCVRQNAGIRAVVALGSIIRLARASVQDPLTTQHAQQDYLELYRQAAPVDSPLGHVLHDVALLVGGQSQKPLDYRPLAAAEDDYLKATAIAAPERACPNP